MANNPDKQLYNKIEQLIRSSRLSEAFLLLKRNMQSFPLLNRQAEELKNAENKYRYMLDYIADGHEEPMRQDVVKQIQNSLLLANLSLLRAMLLKDSNHIYFSTKRLIDLKGLNLSTLLHNFQSERENESRADTTDTGSQDSVATASEESALNELFNYIWTIGIPLEEEAHLITETLSSADFPEYAKLDIVSAIILGNLSFFNSDLLQILLNLYDTNPSIPIKARIVAGILIIALRNPEFLTQDFDLKSRLLLMKEDVEFQKLINDTLVFIIRTFDTARIDKKMRDELIPELMKMGPEFIDKIRRLSSDSENAITEENPEWEELLENSEVGNKLQEINEMQLEGADVMVTAFSNLKSFPFFNSISNWFLPFSSSHYEFKDFKLNEENEKETDFSKVMCDSDLFSFFLSLKTVGEQQRNLMLSNFESQMQKANEAFTSSIVDNEEFEMSSSIRHFLQDLYRFFKYYKKKADFDDPFSQAFSQNEIGPLVDIFEIDSATLKVIAEFYLKHKYYSAAQGLFEILSNEEISSDYWEKIGYCYEKQKQFEKAVEWYKKAELINPDKNWLIKRLGVSLRNSGQSEEALKYFNKALETDPDNFHLLMSAGECLVSIQQPQEALQKFYHASYLRPDKTDALRAIAWAELMSQNFEKAHKQYEKILNTNPEIEDYLNAGHGALAAGDFKSAIKYYKDYINKSENKDIAALIIAFRDDSPSLKQLGIKNSDLRLVVDKIRYDS